MPDFRIQPSFPIASVVDAASRNAQLQEQSREAGNKSIIEGLQGIGQIGESLFNTRQRVAQSLALGRQFDVPDEVSRTMTPEQLMQVGTIKKGQVDMNMLLNMLHPGTGGTTPNVPPVPQPPAPTSSQPTGAALPDHTPEAILASTSPTIPIPGQPDSDIAPPPQGIPVPIQAPPVKPQKVNAATAKMAMQITQQSRPENVLQYVPGKGLVNVGTKQKGDQVITSQPKGPQDIMAPEYQEKLEKQYADMRMKPLSNRSGGLGLQDAKVNQAFDLRKLVNKYYDPKTDTFNIPPSQHSELALGLARLTSPTGQVGIELMHELRQGTGREALSKALIYAGADPTQVGGPTQSVAKMFVDSVDRQGQTAEQLRDQYMQYISDNAPTDLDPARKAKHDQGKLNSFNDFLSKSPDQQKTPSGGGLPQIGQSFNGAKVLSIKRVK